MTGLAVALAVAVVRGRGARSDGGAGDDPGRDAELAELAAYNAYLAALGTNSGGGLPAPPDPVQIEVQSPVTGH